MATYWSDEIEDEYPGGDEDDEPIGPYRPSPLTILLSVLIIFAMLISLMLPIIYQLEREYFHPTPTPNWRDPLQDASGITPFL